MPENRQRLLVRLDHQVDELLRFYRKLPDANRMVYELWTAQDVLAHLTFWHESFARNVSDLARNIQPTPLKGRLSDLNQAGVEAMRTEALATVIGRFEAAHQRLQANILDQSITLIPYRKGSRDYSAEEHLGIVCDHIARHLQDVVNACGE